MFSRTCQIFGMREVSFCGGGGFFLPMARSQGTPRPRVEAQLGLRADWDKIARELITTNASWEQAVQIVEQQLGTSGFTILSKIEQGALLTLGGKPTRAAQYAIGNPLLAIQMIEHAPEAALYAPLRLAVYENRAGKAVVAYERITSQLAHELPRC